MLQPAQLQLSIGCVNNSSISRQILLIPQTSNAAGLVTLQVRFQLHLAVMVCQTRATGQGRRAMPNSPALRSGLLHRPWQLVEPLTVSPCPKPLYNLSWTHHAVTIKHVTRRKGGTGGVGGFFGFSLLESSRKTRAVTECLAYGPLQKCIKHKVVPTSASCISHVLRGGRLQAPRQGLF